MCALVVGRVCVHARVEEGRVGGGAGTTVARPHGSAGLDHATQTMRPQGACARSLDLQPRPCASRVAGADAPQHLEALRLAHP